jgi:hypothetical protein
VLQGIYSLPLLQVLGDAFPSLKRRMASYKAIGPR